MYDDLIQRLLSLPDQESRIRGCRLTGSCATGEADQYSDIDLLIDVEEFDRDAVIHQLPGTIAEIEPVATWYQISAGETLGPGNWRIPCDTLFFLLHSGIVLEVMVDAGVVPLEASSGRYRPVLLALWSTNFPRWAKAVCRHQQTAVDVERERIREQLVHIGLAFPGDTIEEAMAYVERYGQNLCRSVADVYPLEVVSARRVSIDAMLRRS